MIERSHRAAELALPHARREREAHLEGFVARPEAQTRIAAALEPSIRGGYVLVLGGPGAGKSALLAELSERREAPFHFLRSHRDPARFVPSLIAQCDRLAELAGRSSPTRRGLDADELRNELVDALGALSEARGSAQLLIDGLDELEQLESTLAHLPSVLPPHTTILLSSRPDRRALHRLRAKLAPVAEIELGPLELDEVRRAIALWLGERSLGVEPDSAERLLAATGGQAWLVFRALQRARLEGRLEIASARADASSWHEDLYARAVERGGPLVAALVELLSVAREPVELATMQAWLGEDERFRELSLAELRHAVEGLGELLEGGGTELLRLWHASYAEHVRERVLGERGVQRYHAFVARALMARPDEDYARRHLVAHLVYAGQHLEAKERAEDPARLADRVGRGELPELLAELARVDSPLHAPLRRHAALLQRRPLALASLLALELGAEAPAPSGARLAFVDGGALRATPTIGALLGHEDEVLALGASPDGSRLASASADGTARLWARDSALLTWSVKVGTRRVLSLAWSADGRQIAFGSDDAGVVLLDAATGEIVARHAHASPVWGLAWLRGDALAWAGRDGSVEVRATDGALLWSGRVNTQLSALAASRDGQSLAVAGARGGVTILRWRGSLAGEPEATRIRAELEATVWGLAFDGDELAFVRHDGVVELWSVPIEPGSEPRPRAALELFDERPYAIASSAGAWLVGTSTGAIHTLREADGQLVVERSFACDVGAVGALAAIDDELWIGGASGRIEGRSGGGLGGAVGAAAERAPRSSHRAVISAQRDHHAVGDDEGHVRLLGLDGRERWRKRVLHTPVAALHLEARWLAAGGAQGELALWSLGQRGLTRPLRCDAHEAAITCVRVLPEASAVLTGARDHSLRSWSVFGLRPVASVELAASPRTIHVAPDGRTAVVFEIGGGCSSFALPSLERLQSLSLDAEPVGVIFDGEAVALAVARDGELVLQSLSSGGASTSSRARDRAQWLVAGSSPAGRALGLLSTEAAVVDGRGRMLASAPLGLRRWVDTPDPARWLLLDDDTPRLLELQQAGR